MANLVHEVSKRCDTHNLPMIVVLDDDGDVVHVGKKIKVKCPLQFCSEFSTVSEADARADID